MHRKLFLLPLLLVLALLLRSAGAANAQCSIATTPATAYVCKGAVTSYTASSIAMGTTTYQWSMLPTLGTFASPAGSTNSVFWTAVGTTTITVTATTGGVSTTCTAVVNVGAIPEPAITASSQVGCLTMPPPSENPQNALNQFEGGCVKVCENSSVIYTANGPSGSTYTWSATGGTVASTSGNSCVVHWGTPGAGSVTVTETTVPNGCSGTKTICIEIIPKPRSSFGALPDTNQDAAVICETDTLQFVQNSSAVGPSPLVNWYWDFGDGTTFSSSTPTNPAHHFPGPGTYQVMLVVRNACNCTDTSYMPVEVKPGEGVIIHCPSVVCENARASYSVDLTNITCTNYLWSVIGGTIVSPMPYGPTVDVVWNLTDTTGFGYLSFDGSGCQGPNHCTSTTTVKIPVIQQYGHITGADIVCPGSNTLYRMPPWPGTVFNWSVSGPATISHTDQPNEILVHSTGASGNITLTCNYQNTLLGCKGVAKKLIKVLPPATASGPSVACHLGSGTYTLGGGFSGTWVVTLPGGATLPPSTGTSVTVAYNQVGVYTVAVSGTTYCPPDPLSTTVYAIPPPPNTITGPDTVCSGTTYTFSAGAAQSGTVFVWSITGGAFVGATSGANVSVTFAAAGPYSISVRRRMVADPHCESAAITKTLYAPVVGADVTGNIAPCANSYAVYDAGYHNGESYEWGVVPSGAGSVSSGDGTPMANILWNNYNGIAQVWVRVRKCNKFYNDTLRVNVGALPTLTISNNPTVCRDAMLNVSLLLAPGSVPYTAGSVTWDFGDGTVVTVPYPGTTSHAYNVLSTTIVPYTISATITGVNGCPGATIQLFSAVDVLPAPVASVTPIGPIAICPPGAFNIPLTAALQAGYVPTIGLQWFEVLAPAAVLSTGNPYGATAYGAYYVVATGNNGCTDTSNLVAIRNNCGDGGCAIIPLPTITLTPTENCGHVQVTASASGSPIMTSWAIPPTAINVVQTPVSNPTQIDADFLTAGQYEFDYSATYLDASGEPCTLHEGTTVTVPLVPYLLTGLQCNNDNDGYILRLFDNSNHFPGVTGFGYTYFIDNAPFAPTNPATTEYVGAIGQGAHTVFLVVDYVWNNAAFQCTTAVQTIVVPGLPHASFTATTSGDCVDVPIQFTSASTPAGVNHAWDFGDISGVLGIVNPQRVYANAGGYPVTLTVTDQFGCTDDTVTQIGIAPNTLSNITGLSASSICEGSTASLYYTGTVTPPMTFMWMNGTNNFFTTYAPTSGIAVSDNGSYWIHVTDAKRCFIYTNAANLSVTNVPEPVISGNLDQCENTTFTLDGYAGPDPAIIYGWTVNSAPYSGNNSSITLANLTPGTYTVVLTLTVGSCQRASAPFVVTVHPTPAKPSLAFDIADCPTYLVKLTAGLPGPGTVAWSHGTTGTPTYANEGGLYKAWYTDVYGCVSSDSIAVPKDPAGYLWVFPTGCYNLCPPPGGFVIHGPIIPFQKWWYYNGGATVSSGGPGFVPPLVINGPGQYSMSLYNGWCTATIGTLDLSVPDSCNPITCESGFEVQLNGVHYNPSCNFFLDLDIVNPTGVPIPFQIIAVSPGGTMTPATFTASPGLNSSVISQWTPPSPFSGNAVFLVVFTLPNGTQCRYEVYVYNIKCPYGNGLVYRQTAPGVDNGSDVGEGATLTLVPNPAQETTTVRYRFATASAKRTVQVYDVTGRLLSSHTAAGAVGQWPVSLGNWAAGVYQVVLKADGKVVATQRLSVTH